MLISLLPEYGSTCSNSEITFPLAIIKLAHTPQKPPNDSHGGEGLHLSPLSAWLHPGRPIQETHPQGARH